MFLYPIFFACGVVDGTKLKFSDRSLNDYFTVLKSKLSPLYWKKLDDE